jgi:hypothetical protein
MVKRVDEERRKEQKKVIVKEKKSYATWCIIELVC